MRTATEILESFVSDIEGVQKPWLEAGAQLYGPFDGDANWDGMFIQWPNLTILVEEAKELLNANQTE